MSKRSSFVKRIDDKDEIKKRGFERIVGKLSIGMSADQVLKIIDNRRYAIAAPSEIGEDENGKIVLWHVGGYDLKFQRSSLRNVTCYRLSEIIKIREELLENET